MSRTIDDFGKPSWVALTTEDPASARQFYGEVMGWRPPDMAAPGVMPNAYLLRGRAVGEISPKIGVLRSAWRIYVAVVDAEETAKTVVGAGGKIVHAPTRVDKAGRFAVFADHSGAEFAVWQVDEFKGAAAANEPGALAWTELITDDVKASSDFYGAVLGWMLSAPDPADPLQRREWQARGRSVAGLLPRPPAMPKAIPPYWDVIFAVADPAATVETAVRLGAKNLMPPTDIPHGRIAVFADPAGVVFSVIAPRSDAAH
jgi:uncharacterized protein